MDCSKAPVGGCFKDSGVCIAGKCQFEKQAAGTRCDKGFCAIDGSCFGKKTNSNFFNL